MPVYAIYFHGQPFAYRSMSTRHYCVYHNAVRRDAIRIAKQMTPAEIEKLTDNITRTYKKFKSEPREFNSYENLVKMFGEQFIDMIAINVQTLLECGVLSNGNDVNGIWEIVKFSKN